MKTIFVFALFLTTITFSNAANYPVDPTGTDSKIVEASFPGGQEALQGYIASNLIYPSCARENAVEGMVTASFHILPDGSIHRVRILEGLSSACNLEVLRIIESMPKWEPAVMGDKTVGSSMKLAINFQLNN